MNLVVQFSMSCAFRCITSRLAACLLYHFVFGLSRGFLNFFQVFFARFLRNLAFSLASLRLVRCSLAAPIVYHILRPLSSGFSKFFRIFGIFLRDVSISPKYPSTLRNPSGIGVPFAYPDTSLLS